MSFSGGVYTLPGPALVTGEVVSATENNQFRNDVAGAFNLTMLRNGTSTATANLPMGGYKLTGLGAPNTNGDSLAYGAAAVVTTLTSTSLTATRVPYAGTGGLLQDASTFTFDGTTLTAGGFTTSGAISAGTITASGAITVSGGTANGVAYINGSKVLTTGSALTFDGTNLGLGTSPSNFSGYPSITLNGTSGAIISLKNNGTEIFRQSSDTSGTYQYTQSASQPLIWGQVSSELMRLTSTGLGIGTSSPYSKLHVITAAGQNPLILDTGSWNQIVLRVGGTNRGQIYADSTNCFAVVDSTNSYTRMQVSDSGNLGLGVTPSAWGSGYKAFQQFSSVGGFLASGNYAVSLGQNTYQNSSGQWIYQGASYAPSRFEQFNGAFAWLTAPSGTAGNAISFTQAMTLDASGRLLVGLTSPVYGTAGYGELELNGSSGSLLGLNVAGSTGAYIQSNGNLTINNVSAGHMAFSTSNTERMRIDSSGNVGIGTSTINNRLVVESASAEQGITVRGNGFDILKIGIVNPGVSNDGVINVATSNGLRFATNNTERMRIDSSGNLLVGTTSFIGGLNSKVSISQTSSGAWATAVQVNNGSNGSLYTNTSGTSGYTAITFRNNGTSFSDCGGISVSGSTTSYNTSSDYRLKENIQPMQNALARNALLKPCTYSWKSDGSTGEGFIAHELQAVCPDAVTGEKDAVDKDGKPVYQGVDTSFLVGHLVACIQELKAELDATKAEVAALKGN